MLNSLVRTLVPLLVGWLLSLGIVKAAGVTSDQLDTVVTALVTAVYYGLARVLERYVDPKFGWLLGIPGAPSYPKAP